MSADSDVNIMTVELEWMRLEADLYFPCSHPLYRMFTL